jgi:hypothetical protein
MKRIKLFFTGVAVLAITGAAFAFTPRAFSVGTVWCLTSAPNQNQACPGTAAHIKIVSSGGTTSNLCPTPSTQTEYYEQTSSTCVAVGTQQVASTGL